MAERYTPGDPENREETYAPQNPPNSVEPMEMKEVPASAAGVAGMWYVLGPLLLILVVLGVGLYFWVDDPDMDRDDTPAIGTVGSEPPDHTPGGTNPDPNHGGTGDELEYRGGEKEAR